MANITAEDGTIVAGANSYLEVADADLYFAVRGDTTWAALTNPQKEAALIKGTQYIDSKYAKRWKGVRVSTTQPLLWPRNYVVPYENEFVPDYVLYPPYISSTTIPQQVKDAVCEAAFRAASSTLQPDVTSGTLSKAIAGAITTVYSGDSGNVEKKYRIIDYILAPLLIGSNNVVRG